MHIMKWYKENKEVINYLVVGGLTTIVSLAVYYVLVITILNSQDSFQL